VFSSEPIGITEDARFDLHLRKRPHLPHMQDFITAPQAEDPFLNETATTTLYGVLSASASLLNDCAGWLVTCWKATASQTSDSPPPSWGLVPDKKNSLRRDRAWEQGHASV
jgi:hypothetical protein